jgi:hypothetical protein
MDRQAREAILEAGKSQHCNELSSAWAVQNILRERHRWKKFVLVKALASTLSLERLRSYPGRACVVIDKSLLANNLQLDLVFLLDGLLAEQLLKPLLLTCLSYHFSKAADQ